MKDLDRFCGGITAPRKKVVDNPDGERPQPEYGDDWANKTFNQKGPDILKIISRDHK
jgi:hypothetical protein